MTRGLFFVVLTIAPLLVGFAAGAATAVMRGWGDGDVQVDVVNESGQRVKSLALDVQTCGARTVLGRAALEPGERARLRFTVCGEGGYVLRAQFENGAELRGRDHYIENGHRALERVRRADIAPGVPSAAYCATAGCRGG